MIQKVSPTFSSLITNQNKKNSKPQMTSSQKSYMDSFVKNAKDTAPILLGLTALWSVLDYGNQKITMPQSLMKNLAFFFAPVLIVSSAIIAGIENKKPSKNSKE
ncbi:MAG: hypothetical protein E7Z90_02090 [Cyanobacteria bacterium SIG29]|nr:hypothetical protein [Cyanobacteria bacterium SIG29]